MSKSLVSVIIPTYNGSKNIQRAINSVLNQTYPNIEIIVVDDASTDNTVEVVNDIKNKGVKLLRHATNKNGSAARNTGIRASKGEYLAFLDDDDEWLKEKISMQISYLESKKDPTWKGVITGYMYKKGDKWKISNVSVEGDLTEQILSMEVSLGSGSSMMFSKEVFLETGLFDEKYVRHQDLEFILRYLRTFNLATVEEPLVKVYGHSGYVSGDKLFQVKKIFLEDFKQDIEKLGIRNAGRIYARQWLQVSKHYALDGDIKKTLRYLKKSLNYKLLFSSKIRFLILENYIALPYHLLKGILSKNKLKGR